MAKYDLRKLKNGKFYSGTMSDFPEFGNWFVGSFFKPDHPCFSNQIEVCYHKRPAGFSTPPHYHKEKIELLIIISGSARYSVNGKEVFLKTGDFMFADVNNVIEGEFLEETIVIAIHSPSLPKDKFIPEKLVGIL